MRNDGHEATTVKVESNTSNTADGARSLSAEDVSRMRSHVGRVKRTEVFVWNGAYVAALANLTHMESRWGPLPQSVRDDWLSGSLAKVRFYRGNKKGRGIGLKQFPGQVDFERAEAALQAEFSKLLTAARLAQGRQIGAQAAVERGKRALVLEHLLRLLAEGRNERDCASIIAARLRITPKQVREHRRRLRELGLLGND